MIAPSEKKLPFFYRYRKLFVTLVALCGILFSIIVYFFLLNKETQKIDAVFKYECEILKFQINKELDLHIQTLYSIRSLFQASPDVTREQFKSFVSSKLEESKLLQAVTYNKRITDENRLAYEQMVRKEGIDTFEITEMTPAGDVIPAKKRKEYYPVHFVEPLDENVSILGFDIASENIRNEALVYAVNNKSVYASGPIRLVQDTSIYGYIAVAPYFRMYTDKFPVGVVNAIFSIKRIFNNDFVSKIKPGIHITLTDKTLRNDETKLYDLVTGPNTEEVEKNPEINYSSDLVFANRSWRLEFYANDNYIEPLKSKLPLILMILGFLITSLVCSLIYLFSTRAVGLDLLVDEKTSELVKTNKDLEHEVLIRKKIQETLLESENKYRTIIEEAGDVIYTSDYKGNFTYLNPRCENLTGYKSHELIGKHFTELIDEDWKKRVADFYLNQFKSRKKESVFIFPIIKKNGEKIWVEQIVSLLSENGWVVGFQSVVRDVTLRKKAEDQLKKLTETLEERVVERTLELNNSKNQIGEILESITDGFVSLNKDWEYTYVNKRAAETFKKSTAEMVGTNIWKLFPEGIGEPFYHAYHKAMQDNITVQFEEYYKPLDKWFENRVYPSKEGISIFFQDITFRKKAEEEIRFSERQLKEAQRIAHLGTWEWDIESGTVVWSEELYRIFGEDPETYTPSLENYLAHLHLDDRKIVKETIENAIKNKDKEDFYFIERIVTGGGEKKCIKTVSKIIVNEKNDVTGLQGICFDVTELKAAESEVRALNEELEKRVEERTGELMSVNKELEAFSYSVSHDLRAPLRAIDGYAKILENDYSKKLDDEGVRLLGVVQYNAKKMGHLIDDLLAFSRLGKKEIQKVDIDMNDLLESSLDDYKKANGEIKAEFKVGDLLPVKADYGLLNQVLVNMISNAVKYSSKNEKPSIEIGSYKEEGKNIYFIKDNGVGFNMQYADKLFGVFQRLHGMDEFEGTGVGLAIVKRIIAKHGGSVWAEAEVNKGATFYFSLPALNKN